MKDYDAIARGAQEDDTWSIFSARYDKDGKPWRFEITGGINGEGPAYTVGVIEGKERADEICAAHNAAILRKYDEAEAGGEPGEGYWWCPECHEVVDGYEVTFQEYHERCGTKVIAKTAKPSPPDEKALASLAVIEDALNEMKEWDTGHPNKAVACALLELKLLHTLLAREAPKDESKEGRA